MQGSQEMFHIRPIVPADTGMVSVLVRQVFDEHVAPSFAPNGVAEMHAYIAPQAIVERARTHITLVAWEGSLAVGVIELRDEDHVSMLFVRTSHMGRGIAAVLMARAEAACRAAGRRVMTVNSSLNAQSYYKRLGFVPVGELQCVGGFAFVPMERPLL